MMEDTLRDLALWLMERGVLKDELSFIDTYTRFNMTIHHPHWSHAFGEIELFGRTIDTLSMQGVQPKKILNKYRELFEARTHPDPDVIEAFRFLKERGIKTALISNERSACVEMFTRRTGMGSLLDAAVVSEEVGVEKPHPIIFGEVKRRLGVEFPEMVIFGDSEVTDGGGKKLGMKYVLVEAYRDPGWAWGKGNVVEPDYTIERVTRREVERCLKAIKTTMTPE